MRIGAYKIAGEIAKRTGYRKEEITPIVCMVFDIMKEELSKGRGITIRDFGRFDIIERNPYEMYNGQTKERFMTGYKARVKFQQSRKLGVDLSARFDPNLDWGKGGYTEEDFGEIIDGPLKDEDKCPQEPQ